MCISGRRLMHFENTVKTIMSLRQRATRPLGPWRTILFLILAATAIVERAAAERGYVITTSKYFMASSDEVVCIDLVELRAEVTLHLIDAGNPHFPPLAVNQTDGSISEQVHCLELQVPPLAADTRVVLRAHVTGEGWDGEPFRETSEKPISLMTSTLETFVQTDKPIYRAGQAVRIRVLTLTYPSMRPYTEQYHEIYITTPNDIRVRQWRAVETQEGLIDLVMQLSDDPVLGTWTIHAAVEDSGPVTTQTFKIDEYVLPKFDVIISPPSYIFALDEDIQFSVCALYTYGQPVRGSIAVEASIERTEDLIPLRVEDTGDDGCHSFTIPLSRFTTSRLFEEKYLILDVNFTEAATGVRREETHGTTKVTKKPFTLDISGPDGFKPGLPYRCQVLAKLPNGLPAGGKEIALNVQTSVGSGDFSRIERTIATDASGYADVEFMSPLNPYITELRLDVSYNHPDQRISRVSATKNIDAWYSPSGSFLAVRPPTETVTGTLNAELEFVIPVADSENIIEFTYYVFANRNLVSAGTHTWSPGASPTEEVPRSVDLAGQGIQVSTRAGSVTQHTDPPQLVAYQDAIRAETFIPIGITSRMAPEATILVFFTTTGGEVVSGQQEFSVALAFENEVSLQFDAGQVYPGLPVSLSVHAAPGSLCAIGSVDRSILLMEASNRITKEKIFEPMSEFALDISGQNSTCPQTAHHLSRRPSPPRFWYNPQPRRRTKTTTWTDSKHLDALTPFKTTGATVLSNFQLETRPCYDYTKITEILETVVRFHSRPTFDRGIAVPFGHAGRFSKTGPRGVPGPVFHAETETVQEASGPIYQLRTHFPETWLWHLSRIGGEGVTSVSHTVPHTITDWVTTAFCTSAEKGVGVAEPVSLTVFQPFFVSVTLPYSVVRHEVFPLKITVFNYLSQCFTVAVSVEPTSDFSIRAERPFQFLCICGNRAESVDFEIIPRRLGDIPITVIAQYVPPADGMPPCGHSSVLIDSLLDVWDGVNRTVLVEAEGAEVERVQSLMLCTDGTQRETREISFELPQQAAPNSGSCKVQVTGNVLGSVLTNLGSLLRMPTGCGEQNMIGFTPNIFVLIYLDRTDQREVLPDVYDQALEYMRIGYERELGYRLNDGSYSAFGQRDGVGSTWLTAFVLKSFALASEFIDIDSNDLAVTREWLLDPSTQNGPNRCFTQRGRVIHKEMQGGHTDNGVTLTAYVAIALLEAGEPATSMVLFRATFCLVQAFDAGIEDMYTLALVTYALAKAGIPYYRIALEALDERAVNGDGTRHWVRSDSPPCDGGDSCKADPTEIEMTAYVLLTYLEDSEENPDRLMEAGLVVEWLNGQRNSHGGFTSTQDTVIGLQALALYAERVYSADKDVRVDIATTEGNLQEEHVWVTGETDLLMSEFEIRQCPNNLRMTAEGEGCVLLQTVTSFSLPVLRLTQSYFDVRVGVRDHSEAQDCSYVYLDIAVRYLDPVLRYTNMAVVEVKMVSGYSVDTDMFFRYLAYREQIGQDIGIRRYDTFQQGRPFALYFDQFGYDATHFTLVLKRDIHVKNTQDGYVKVYDYYEGGVVTYKSYHPCHAPTE